ncbi:phosphate-starvation-inducible protein PsiE [Paenibacillus sp. NEAU-GSW1]|uniref:phosphate-starvation-inducible protein PsiE n=1 Tax=Paenibacillus sp. NEAU-GSW1 TaxID=2682486 RepID=UPI0012E2E2F0|nr:phosphate-starvation-inducible protein PsiE [Paenibacillus sp. NEAU-GSW1]MUT68747.1 phosphate-starvation-inducible protein PsiE [Paenibacillus sp. NEAU-GSW1]
MNSNDNGSKWADVLQFLLNIMLLALGAILVLFLVREIVVIFDSLLIDNETVSYMYLAEGILVFFLYFEFISLVVKYFSSNFHFPLRFFIYIGITAILRLIIINHEEAWTTLAYSLSILVLVIALYIAQKKSMRDT